jgi:hypothetical protein
MPSKNGNGSDSEDICLACGLCCNGAIFADVKLQPGDDASRFQALGVGLTQARPQRDELAENQSGLSPSRIRTASFPQPCAAFDGCRCQIYAERPKHCRQFECLLLQRVRSGKCQKPVALDLIRKTRERADKVWRLLRELGDTDEHLALKTRFERTARRMEASGCDDETALLYSELTLAVHDLNLVLSESFYR